MNVWLLQIGEILPLGKTERKLRTTLIAEKLVERGHKVFWWASAFDHFGKSWMFNEDTRLSPYPGLEIFAMKGTGYRRNFSFSRFLDHRRIAQTFRKSASSESSPDIIVASFPSHDLACEAVRFGKKLGIPVVVDIRDKWPDIFLSHFPGLVRPLIRWLLWKDFRMAAYVFRNADALLAMQRNYLYWGIHVAKRGKSLQDRVFYLGYSADSRELVSTAGSARINYDLLRDNFVVTFIGTFSIYHDPSIMIECAEKLKGERIVFILAGRGEMEAVLRKKAAGLENIIFTGWLNQAEITELLKFSHVGICPTPRKEEIEFFPNKVFAYLSAGLPVLSAFRGEIEEILNEYNIGFTYAGDDIESFTRLIKLLYTDKTIFRIMSGNAKMTFTKYFDAEKIISEYVHHIEEIAARKEK